MKAMVLVLIAVLGDAIVAVGDICARRWSPAGGFTMDLVLALVCYLAVGGLWLAMLRVVGGLVKASILWVASGTLIPVLIGHFVFGEAVGWKHGLAVGLCAAAAALTAL